MELPSLEEEATMSYYGDEMDARWREPYYDDPYEYGDADEVKPGDAGTEDDDSGWPYPDTDDPEPDTDIYPECEHTPPCLLADGSDTPCGAKYDDWPSEPEDWRHGEPAGDE